MAATLAEIRAGLAANLNTLTGAPMNVQVSAYMLGNPTPPTLQVMGPDLVEWDKAMLRGLDTWTIVIQGFVGSPTDVGAQVVLDKWLDPTGGDSVKTALEVDSTLGGKVQDSSVTSCSGYRIYNLDNRGATLGAEWTVLIYNTGK